MTYPIFITTKGRAGACYTQPLLDDSGLSYTMVVDPSEAAAYASDYPGGDCLPVPSDDYGLGPTRQFLRDHARATGLEAYWIMDDDVKDFRHFTQPGTSEFEHASAGESINALEAEFDSHPRVAIAAFNWQQYAWRALLKGPYTLNTRAYLCALHRTTPINYHPQFEVKSDVAFVLEHLAKGYDTLLYHEYAFNTPGMTQFAGGCSPAYQSGVQNNEAVMLNVMYPDFTRIVDKGAKGLDVTIQWKKFTKAHRQSITKTPVHE